MYKTLLMVHSMNVFRITNPGYQELQNMYVHEPSLQAKGV